MALEFSLPNNIHNFTYKIIICCYDDCSSPSYSKRLFIHRSSTLTVLPYMANCTDIDLKYCKRLIHAIVSI